MRVVGVASLDSGLCFESAAGPGGAIVPVVGGQARRASRYGPTSGVDRVATIVVSRGSWRLSEDEAYARAMQAEEHALMEQIAATVAKDEKSAWDLSESDSPAKSRASSASSNHAPPSSPGSPPSVPPSRHVIASPNRFDVIRRDQVKSSAEVKKGPRERPWG